MHGAPPETGEDNLKRLYELGKQPELVAWLERHGDRAQRFTPAEVDELLSLQGPNGALAKFGVEQFVELIERKRQLRDRVEVIAATEYLELLERLVDLLYEKVQPR